MENPPWLYRLGYMSCKGKTIIKEGPFEKMAAPVSSRKFSRQRGWSNIIFEVDNEPTSSHTGEMSKIQYPELKGCCL